VKKTCPGCNQETLVIKMSAEFCEVCDYYKSTGTQMVIPVNVREDGTVEVPDYLKGSD